MTPNQREYEIVVMGQTKIYIYVVILPLLHTFNSCYLHQMQTELSKKDPVKVVPHGPAQTERGLQWFQTSFRLLDNSITKAFSLIPNKEEWSYKRRTISNKQYNKTLHHSSTSTEQLEMQTIMQHLLQAFLPKQHLMIVWLKDSAISKILEYLQ